LLEEFTLTKLVKKYGSKAQKQSLKEKGNLSGKEFAILLKSVETEWESYKVDGRGSKRIITCSGKRLKKIERVDKRVHNGKGQLVGEFELNSLVVNFLIRNDNKVSPMSANKWITELGIVDGKILGVLYGSRVSHLEHLQDQFSSVIKDYNKADSDFEMLDEFLQISLKHNKSSLVSVFKKLAESKVIIHQTEVWGCTTTKRYRKLTRQEIQSIADIRQDLLNLHGLKDRDLFKTNMKAVKDFQKNFDEQLDEHLGLKFSYKAHLCVLQESGLGVSDYLDRLQEKDDLNFTHNLTEDYAIFLTDLFKDKQSNHSLELAKGRQRNTYNKSDTDRIQYLKIMQQYAPMWELLMKYFRCTDSCKLNLSGVEESASTNIEIDGLEVGISIEQKKTNPLAEFQAIRMIAEMNSESKTIKGGSLN